MTTEVAAGTMATAPVPATIPAASRVATWAAIVWAAGVVVCLLPLILGRLSLRRIRRGAQPAGAAWATLIEQASRQVGLARPVTVQVTKRRTMPLVWGLARPHLLLPAEAETWPAERRRVVLLHELAHVRRYDCAAKVVARAACALHWFNPMAWLALRWMEIEAEAACDDLVLAAGEKPSDYAGHLLETVASLPCPRMTAPSSISLARPSRLEGRLLRILDDRRSRRQLTRRGLVAAAFLIVAIVLPLSMLRATAADKAKADKPAAAATDSAASGAKPAATQTDEKAAAVAAQVKELVAGLGAKDVKQRDEAEKKLIELASAADIDELLVKALDNPDPEIRARMAKVMEAPEWGEADQGLRMALRPQKREWKVGEMPTVSFVIKNTGDQKCTFSFDFLEFQVDDVWYATHDRSKGYDGLFRRFELPPRSEVALPAALLASALTSEGGRLVLKPGRHIVRSAASCQSFLGESITARPVSRAVVIEVLDAGGKRVEPVPPAGKAADKPAGAALAAQVNELVAQLAAKDAAKRDEAEKKLIELASAADIDELLVKALDNPDAEIRARVAKVLEAPQWGEAAKGLRVAAILTKRQWLPGERLALAGEIRNDSQEGMRISDAEWDFQVDGQQVRAEAAWVDVPLDLEPGRVLRSRTLQVTYVGHTPENLPLPVKPGWHVLRVGVTKGPAAPGQPGDGVRGSARGRQSGGARRRRRQSPRAARNKCRRKGRSPGRCDCRGRAGPGRGALVCKPGQVLKGPVTPQLAAGELKPDLFGDLPKPPANGPARWIVFLKLQAPEVRDPVLVPAAKEGWYRPDTPELEQKIIRSIPLPTEWSEPFDDEVLGHRLQKEFQRVKELHNLAEPDPIPNYDGLQLGLRPRAGQVAMGDALVVEVCLRNAGKQERTTEQFRYTPMTGYTFWFTVRDDGGRQWLLMPSMDWRTAKAVNRTVGPGETYVYPFYLNEWLAVPSGPDTGKPIFTRTGRYTITCHWGLTPDIVIDSPPVTVTVVAPAPSTKPAPEPPAARLAAQVKDLSGATWREGRGQSR